MKEGRYASGEEDPDDMGDMEDIEDDGDGFDEDDDGADEDSDGDDGDDDVDAAAAAGEGQNGDVQSIKRKRKDQGTAGSRSKRNKLSEAALMKPPTASELHQLRETENLFHSNLFRLQIEEILKEVKPKQKHITSLQQWLEQLKTFLLEMTLKKSVLSNCTWLEKRNIKFPLPDKCIENAESNSKFAFIPPTDVSFIGSFPSDCYVGRNVQVDVKVEMPKECLCKEDELNYGYHRKRALYLCYIASKLSALNIVGEMWFSHQRSPFSPTLELKPSGKLGKTVIINIHVSVPQTTFKLVRFAPSKSKISSQWYFGSDNSDIGNVPTPHYNTSVLQDLTLNTNVSCMSEITGSPNIRDGIVLLKIWLRQNQFLGGYGGFSGFIITMYVVYLLRAKRLNKLMSSYQIVRNVWNSIGQSDWVTNGITMVQTKVENQPSMAEFYEHFEVVFVDSTGFMNLCADVSKETFLRLKSECVRAVKCLDNPNINSFAALFLTMKPLQLQCDHVISLQNSTLTKLVKNHSPREKQVDYGGSVYPQALSLILDALRRGLEQRVSLIHIQHPDTGRWSISEKQPATWGQVTMGFILNPDHAFNILEKGPEAIDRGAEDFRHYWGNKCELRRFPDGSITEVLTWGKPHATMAHKRLVTREIVVYLLSSKLNISPEEYAYLADQFEMLLESARVKPAEFEYGTGEEAAVQVIRSFDSLTKQLRELTDLPLDVSTVQGNVSVFRYTDPCPPLVGDNKFGELWNKNTNPSETCVMLDPKLVRNKIPRYIQPVEAVIQLGMSGKWPEDLGAVRRIQAAFYITIAKHLTEQHKLMTQPYPTHVDILKDGFVFRLVLGNQREVNLLKRMVMPDGTVKYKDTEESVALEKRTEHLPKLTSALHGVYMRYPAFGPACCLAKRWMRCHLIDNFHFPDECIELLVCALYLRPQPFTSSAQPQVAFFRFLRLLAETDWSTECLVINLNDELTRDDIMEIESNFNKNRATLPSLFIATSFDHSGSVWTKERPTLQILIRVAQLAAESFKIISNYFFTAEQSAVNVTQLFRPDTAVYDVVIHIFNHMNARFFDAVPVDKVPSCTLKESQDKRIPVVGFNPVQRYVDLLREIYSDVALFFFDNYGGDKIAVLWKPICKDVKDFKVSHVNYQKLTESSKLTFNIEAVIEDFFILGNGVVRTIETKPGT